MSSQTLLIGVCLLASICSTLGMKTYYYRDGQVCEACADDASYSSSRHTNPSSDNHQVVYRTEERIISSRPSSSYVVNRDDSGLYSTRN